MDGARRQNMSDYIANLNTPLPAPEPSNDFDDANIFATTDFFNFDFDNASTLDPAQSEVNDASRLQEWHPQSNSSDFLGSGDFTFNPVQPIITSQPSTSITSSTTFPLDLVSHTSVSVDSTSSKTKSQSGNTKLSVEERTRVAAEEDKRRRNTAASARFRVKKKQREQQLEKTAKEMTEKVTKLENRVNELEMENRWLKGLITDKNENDGDKLSEMFAKVKEELGEKGLDALSGLLNDAA